MWNRLEAASGSETPPRGGGAPHGLIALSCPSAACLKPRVRATVTCPCRPFTEHGSMCQALWGHGEGLCPEGTSRERTGQGRTSGPPQPAPILLLEQVSHQLGCGDAGRCCPAVLLPQ